MTAIAENVTGTDSDAWLKSLDRLRNRKPREDWVRFDDAEAVEAEQQARQTLRQERSDALDRVVGADPDAPPDSIRQAVEKDRKVKAAVKAHEAAKDEVDEYATVWHFRALPPDLYESLHMAHPPTDEDSERGLNWNPRTYMPALIAASSVNPITEAQVRALAEPRIEDGVNFGAALSSADYGILFAKCRELNEVPRVSLGKGSRPTRNSERS